MAVLSFRRLCNLGLRFSGSCRHVTWRIRDDYKW